MAYKFNPIKQDESGKQAKRVIWSTESLDMAIRGLTQGRRLLANPFYENDIRLLKGDLNYQRTEEEIQEWLKCKEDIIYFAENYCKLMTPLGIRQVELRDYQKKYLRHVTDNQLSIYLAVRQCGKTTSTAVALLHYICFNTDKNALVCGNKRKTAVEIVDKIKKIFYELPFFIKPGIYKWNEAEIALDNGCRIQGEATTTNSGIGFTIHWLLLDEFAHIPKNIAEPFYNNIFPTVTAAKAKCTITSTQNGRNLFYRLYKAAEEGISDYKPFKTDWYEVPEWDADKKCFVPRDEEWYNKQIANFGSLEAFNSQFGCDFDISSDGLINNNFLKKVQSNTKTYLNSPEISNGLLGNYWYFDTSYINRYLEKDKSLNLLKIIKNLPIVITIDISEGIGKDYTCFLINTFDRSKNNNKNIGKDSVYSLRNIGYFRSNKLSRQDQVKELLKFLIKFCDYDKTLVSIEYNTYGELFYQEILKQTDVNHEINSPNSFNNINNFDNEYLNQLMNFDRNVIVKYYTDPQNPKKWIPGIRLNSKNKPLACNLFKESFESSKFVCEDEKFLGELANFIKNPNNDSYAASFGNDDLVMSAIQTELLKSTTQFKMLYSELDGIFESIKKYLLDGSDNNLNINHTTINNTPDNSLNDYERFKMYMNNSSDSNNGNTLYDF